MMSLHDRVRRAIERDALLPPGSRVVVAVSGGSDSVALLELLVDLAPTCRFTIAALAHVNHSLRGADSDDDEEFCRALAESHHLRFECVRVDVAARAKAERTSEEVAGRRARYEFFEAASARVQANRTATGHTRDDQAETFLLRLLRGAGATGLSGVRPRRGAVVRPVLDVRREELRAFLATRHQRFREDASNADLGIPRNWIRHRLVPQLAAHLNADIVEVLARESAVLRDESALLERLANEAAARIVTTHADRRITLDAAALDELNRALARRVVRQALARIQPDHFHGFDHVEQVLALAAPVGERMAADLPGVRVERNGANVVLSRGESRERHGSPSFSYELAVPGRTVIPEADCAIEARVRKRKGSQILLKQALASGQNVAVIDAAAASGLVVRSRRAGDSLRPFGMRGRKKLQDVLVDRKVPRAQRDRVPIVCDGRDRILWVAGQVACEDGRITDSTQAVVILKLSRLGEDGDEA